jgi:hypothetical protein
MHSQKKFVAPSLDSVPAFFRQQVRLNVTDPGLLHIYKLIRKTGLELRGGLLGKLLKNGIKCRL